ncbi:hypothetical protein MJA45_02620 [Paenibacillus aurantius]|uniref:Uridine kinase n=1 Tax=Paenibacillus aurantius TaxID=2918900 RepID=A0AA96LI78_9BACL|nr:hypothetical protein [Paenibacillus aurantius]WNQ11972.1 hypothetical protein MJA45_02620 [Paenibacillus aurantius]
MKVPGTALTQDSVSPGKRPLIISISGVSGGGKTTFTKHMSKSVPGSAALHFDDYELEGPEDICEWIERGGDPAEWKLEPLLADLLHFIEQDWVEYVWLDYPFGRDYPALAGLIDLTVFVDTPLDIALARRILRDCPQASAEEILADLTGYLKRGRPAYLHMLENTRPRSDLPIDGTLSVEEMAGLLLATDLIKRRGSR